MDNNIKPVGYRLEWRTNEYCFYSVADFGREVNQMGARIWPLFTEPQPGCSPDVVVYMGKYWMQPKYMPGRSVEGMTPLYLGPMIHDPEAQAV